MDTATRSKPSRTLGRRVQYANDGVDYPDGLRLLTEGRMRLDGVQIARIGLYRRDSEGRAFVRERTVDLPIRSDTYSTYARTLRRAVYRELYETH